MTIDGRRVINSPAVNEPTNSSPGHNFPRSAQIRAQNDRKKGSEKERLDR